jgi:hypothetical protein
VANILAPFGFRWARQLTGTAPNCAVSTRKISASYATPIYHNDPVINESTGYIQQGVAGETTPIAGIFAGCKYHSTSQGRTIWSNYWPGSDATGDVEAYIIDDPNAVFMVQANGGPVALSAVGSNADFIIGTGTPSSGMSGASLDATTVNTTATLPFRIVGYVGDTNFSGVGPGSDPTSANNYVLVTLNNQAFKTLTGV